MRGFLRSNTFKILIIVLVVMSSIMILSQTLGKYSLANLFGFVSTPMQSSINSLTEEDNLIVSGMSREELEEYCLELLEENSQLRTSLIDYYDIKNTNELYEEALNITSENSELELAPANVISKDPTNVFGDFNIDVGINNNVEIGDCVITSSGVVGIISSVYSTYSTVSTIFSEDVSIGSVAKEFNEIGVTTGNSEATINSFVKMEYLESNTSITNGTIICTSGDSGSFPSDIIIGKVYSVESEKDSTLSYALVESYVDFQNLSQVFVVTDFVEKIIIQEETEELEKLEESSEGDLESQEESDD